MLNTGFDSFKKGDNWKAYTERLNSFISLNDIPKDKQKSLLITQLSTPVYEILCGLCAPDSPQDPKLSFADLVQKLDIHLHPRDKYIARLEYNRRFQGHQEIIKEYKLREHLTEGAKSEVIGFKVLKGQGSVKDLIKIATEVQWDETETYEKELHSSVNSNKKTELFAMSSQIQRSQQRLRRKIVSHHRRRRNLIEKQGRADVSAKICYCRGKDDYQTQVEACCFSKFEPSDMG